MKDSSYAHIISFQREQARRIEELAQNFERLRQDALVFHGYRKSPPLFFHFWKTLWWPAYTWHYTFSKGFQQELSPETVLLHVFHSSESEDPAHLPTPSSPRYTIERFLQDAWMLSPTELDSCIERSVQIYDELELERTLQRFSKMPQEAL